MKYLLLGAATLALSACTPPQFYVAGDPGNPAHSAYPGSQNSVYDSTANPPATPTAVAYNPNAASSLSTPLIMPPAGPTH